MTIDTYGAPAYSVIIDAVASINEATVWQVSIDGVNVSTGGKTLKSIINDLKESHGIMLKPLNDNGGPLFIRNISAQDHILNITYTGTKKINHPSERYLTIGQAKITNDGRSYEIPLGGFNAATVWTYPQSLSVEHYPDCGKTKKHISGNAYVLEVDGIKYRDLREFENENTTYGDLQTIIDQNNLNNKFSVRPQASIDGAYHNLQLVNLDTEKHSVKYYLDTTRPYGNTNMVAAEMGDLYRGKAIYCTTDSYALAPNFGSVDNRVVDENGFAMTLAKAPLQPFTSEHSYNQSIDSRYDTLVKLNGTATTSDDEPLSIMIKLGDDIHYPIINEEAGTYSWELNLSSKDFANITNYTVITERLGGVNGFHYKEIVNVPNIYKQFTTYDAQGLETSVLGKTVNRSTFTIPNLYTAEEIENLKYVAGTRSGVTTVTDGISISGDNLVIKDFANAWLSGTLPNPSGSIMKLLNWVGEIGIMQNTSNNTYVLDLIINAEVPKASPLYSESQFDYAYVAVSGLKEAVFETTMFSAEGFGQCFYIEETDTNLWIMRV